MSFPKPEYITHDGFRLAVYEAGRKTGQPVVFVHGWPEMAYSWKHQLQAFSKAGYRAIALDLRGFGKSDAPTDIEHYGISQVVSDIEAVLDALNLDQTVLVGHDWGGIIVWQSARMLARRVSHVISLCTPLVHRAPVDPIKIFRKRYGDEHYFVHFTDRPGEADALFAQNPDAFFRLMFQKPSKNVTQGSAIFHTPARFKAFLDAGAPDAGDGVMSEANRHIYVKQYRRSGFHGGLNLYRNTRANWELTAGLSELLNKPTLMISAEHDVFLPPEAADRMYEIVPDLECHTLKDCGHWVMWEQPEAVNAFMLDWLSRRM